MVGDQQIGAPLERLVDHRSHRVDREQHPAHHRVGVAAHQADRVPGRRQRRVVTTLDYLDDLAEANAAGTVGNRVSHARRLPVSGLDRRRP